VGKGARASNHTEGVIALKGALGTSITFLFGATGNNPPSSGGFEILQEVVDEKFQAASCWGLIPSMN